MNARQIIAAATKSATVDGYTSYPAMCVLYEAEIHKLCHDLDTLTGKNAIPARGLHHHTSYFGAAEVLVEFEYEGPSGDGWNEPRYEAQVTVIGVFLNGVWCDAEDVASEKTIARWEEEIWTERAEAQQTTAEDAAEARAEMRRDAAVMDREWVTL